MALYDSFKVFGEGGEGRFHNQAKHSGVVLVDDGATVVLDLLLD